MLTAEQMKFYSPHQAPAAARPTPISTPVALVTVPEVEPGQVTSAVAREAFGWKSIGAQAQAVLEVMRIAHRAGVVDMTGQELRKWYQRVHAGKDIDSGAMAGRLNELAAGKRIEKLPRRLCTVTCKPAAPHKVVAQQARLEG